MKRDFDLIRALLLKMEGLPVRPGGIVTLRAGMTELEVEGFSVDQIDYHLDQIAASGFINTGNVRLMDGGLGFRSLTPAGHDYLDTVRDPEVWRKTKDRAAKAGGITLGLMKDIGVAVIKGELSKLGWPIG